MNTQALPSQNPSFFPIYPFVLKLSCPKLSNRPLKKNSVGTMSSLQRIGEVIGIF
jgi:hypothetical protein